MQIQEEIRSGKYNLIWSYIMDYENSKNPFRERREQIAKWRAYSTIDIEEDDEIIKVASMIHQREIKNIDSVHIACAIKAKADYFPTHR